MEKEEMPIKLDKNERLKFDSTVEELHLEKSKAPNKKALANLKEIHRK
jgi:hypothetical protein